MSYWIESRSDFESLYLPALFSFSMSLISSPSGPGVHVRFHIECLSSSNDFYFIIAK
jgi:hypothetical protein